jgi:two-component system, LytTR family, response regulator LytT
VKWRTLIVDDELPAREELAFLLSHDPRVEVIGQASTGMEAVKKTKEFTPDLILLDIQLPDFSGLHVAQIVSELGIETTIVFITAYNQYAIEAFKLRAFHYLLKPYDEEDLAQVIHLLGKKEKKKETNYTTPKLAIETETGVKYLFPKEIVYISKNKDDKNVTIHTRDKQYVAAYTLQELSEKLSPFSFFRVHKSYLVNLEFVEELQTFFHGTFNLHLADIGETIVPVSRNYVKELRQRLEL